MADNAEQLLLELGLLARGFLDALAIGNVPHGADEAHRPPMLVEEGPSLGRHPSSSPSPNPTVRYSVRYSPPLSGLKARCTKVCVRSRSSGCSPARKVS